MFESFDEHMLAGPAGKNLHVRATGKFYTPQVIATELVDQIIAVTSATTNGSIRVIDPFCGDGRLVAQLVRAMALHHKHINWDIVLWDCDTAAVRVAAEAVQRAIRKSGHKGKVFSATIDTFQNAHRAFNSFDIVITNPPWETIKPDRRELEFLPVARRVSYTNTLRARDQQIAQLFPLSQPARKFSGWGTNLARVGTEIALRLCRSDSGVCGLVSPASLLGDQVSRGLREWLFSAYSVETISFFPAEGRFFDGVDQPVITMVARRRDRSTARTGFRIFNSAGTLLGARELDTSRTTLAACNYTMPIQFGPDAVDALANLRGLPIFADLEGNSAADLWAGRELDETARARYLTKSSPIRFAKGKMVTRYTTSATPKFFVNPNAIKIPTSVSHLRLGWRDVSRPNQKRRMHASLIPKNWAAGNSLHVAYFRDDDCDRLLALLAVLNSVVCEFQIRARLATAHMSLGVVRQSYLPDLTSKNVTKSLASLARRCLDGDDAAHASAEVAVARAYGLGRASFGRILELFPKLNSEEKELMMAPTIWSQKFNGATHVR